MDSGNTRFDELRAESYQEVIRRLNQAGLPYVVTRGATQWPYVSGDLDLLTAPATSNEIVELIKAALETSGDWDCAVVCRHVDVPVVFGGRATDPQAFVEIDVASRSQWAAGEYADVEAILDQRCWTGQYWKPSVPQEAVLQIVPALLGMRTVDHAKRESRLELGAKAISTDRKGFYSALSESIGSDAAAATIMAIEQGDYGDLRRIGRSVVRQRYIRKIVKDPAWFWHRARYLYWSKPRHAQCGLWVHQGRALLPIRDVDRSPADWKNRLNEVARSHRGD